MTTLLLVVGLHIFISGRAPGRRNIISGGLMSEWCGGPRLVSSEPLASSFSKQRRRCVPKAGSIFGNEHRAEGFTRVHDHRPHFANNVSDVGTGGCSPVQRAVCHQVWLIGRELSRDVNAPLWPGVWRVISVSIYAHDAMVPYAQRNVGATASP